MCYNYHVCDGTDLLNDARICLTVRWDGKGESGYHAVEGYPMGSAESEVLKHGRAADNSRSFFVLGMYRINL